MGQCRDLWHVGDGDDLVLCPEEGHLAADGSGDLTANISINFVEDHERDLILFSERALHGKHNAGHFPA